MLAQDVQITSENTMAHTYTYIQDMQLMSLVSSQKNNAAIHVTDGSLDAEILW